MAEKPTAPSYDLTTAAGIAAAGMALSVLTPMGQLMAVAALARHFFKPSVEEQAQSAADLIKAGAENNVDEMEITLSEEAGLHIKSAHPDVPIKLTVGKSGTVTMKVKYRSPPTTA
ncbi:hypothetical protein ACLB90_01590 [Stenotrophomonas sp. LGBM10]|uniref:hypothetical protein n=1 Tax=Stenotrophomonas sp. LGBM10 TaxID=3390038 RepID=UPI00398BA5B4